MTARIRKLMLICLLICLLTGMSPAAYAMNSEMTFNLDGFTLDTPELPQQGQVVQPLPEGYFQQSTPQQSFTQQALPENSIQFDQGFTAGNLFGESEGEEDEYKLTWDETADPYIASVSIVGQPVVKNAVIKKNQTVLVELMIPAGYKVTYCEASCLVGTMKESHNIEPIGEGTQKTFTTPPDLCSDVTLSLEVRRSYPILIDGFPVTDEGIGNTVSYNPERSLLMLSNANVGSIDISTPLTILFTGDNYVQTIHSNSALTISSSSENSQLTVTVPAEDVSRAIYVQGASLTISSGANVFAKSLGGGTLSAGVDVAGYLEVSGKLTAEGGSASESYGIRCNTLAVKTASSSSGGDITATGGECYAVGNSTGIAVTGNAMVEYRASLTAVGRGALKASYGMLAGGLTVRGTANLEAGNGWTESTALTCYGEVATWGDLNVKSGTCSGGVSTGITATKLSVAGGSLDVHASSGGVGSVGIKAETTISGGTVLAEGMSSAFSVAPAFSGGYQPLIRVSDLIAAETEADSSVATNYLKKKVFIRSRSLILTPDELTIRVGESQKLSAAVPSGYSVKWFSSTPNVMVDQITGTVTGISAGTAIVTAKAYDPSNAETDSATCTVTVKGGSGAVTGIHFDQENVSLSTKYGLRTVKYWFSPLGTGGAELTWKCTDATGSIVRFEVSEAEQELYITSVGNGVAVISASTKNGISAYCRVTVSGIGGETSIYIDYIDNSGVWYYDWSDSFSVRCTGKISELLGVYIDGVYIPQLSTAGQRNYTVSDSGGKTLIKFTREYMARLYRGAHTLTLSYSGYGTLSKTIYIQSVRDAPRTGDIPLAGFTAECLFSFAAAACCIWKLKKKEHR